MYKYCNELEKKMTLKNNKLCTIRNKRNVNCRMFND